VTPPRVEVRLLSTRDDFLAHDDVLQRVWGMSTPLVTLEMLTAIAHSGGYVAGAFDLETATMVGASVGFLADHHGHRALHSHVTGVLPEVRHAGLGRSMKLHQRAWAAEHGLAWITWTFDPLVRRNAWFNLAILGADVDAYLPSFYGTMTDAINVGDESDRLLTAWNVHAPVTDQPRDGRELTSDGRASDAVTFVPTPSDIVELRRTDPAAVARWRADTRMALTTALDAGKSVLGFTRDGHYVIGSAP